MDQASITSIAVASCWPQYNPAPQAERSLWLGRETESINPLETKVCTDTTASTHLTVSSVWTPTPSELVKMGTVAFHDVSVAPDNGPGLDEEPICEAILQIVKGRKYIVLSGTDEPPSPSTLGGTPLIDNPAPIDEDGSVRKNATLTQAISKCISKCKVDKLRSDTTSVGQAPSAKAIPSLLDIPSVNHSAIIRTLRALRGKKVTANFEYIKDDLSSGFASISPRGSSLCIQVFFKKNLATHGIAAKILQKNYVLSGNLIFDDKAMIKRVTSMPAWCFMKESRQHISPNPLCLAQNSIKIFKKEPPRELIKYLYLTKDQKEVYDIISSLFNKQINTDIVSLRNTPKPEFPLSGQACFYLNTGRLLFISFKIPAKEVALGIEPSVYLKQGKVRGRLRYDEKWLLSQISRNSPLLYSSPPKKIPDDNKIFFPASSVSLYFHEKKASE